MSAGLKQRSEMEVVQNILINQDAMNREVEELKRQNEELKTANDQLKQDVKDFEIFRPILETPLIEFYAVRLSDSSVMKQLIARAAKQYGKRLKLEVESGEDKRYARQMLSGVVTACVRYCVSNNGRWNEVVARYLSGAE